jgi:hypothetical protein
MGASHLDPQGLPPAGDDPWDQPAADHLRRGRPAQRPWLYQVTRKAVSAAFTAFLDQVLSAYPTAPRIAVICDNVIMSELPEWLALVAQR